MKILVVSSFLPFPLHSGGQVRLYNLLTSLSKHHELTLICEMRSTQTQSDCDALSKICKKVITVPRRKQWSIQNILKSGMSKNSFLVTGHTHKEMQKEITEELARDSYDLIHVETYYVMQNVPKVSLPIVLAEHNIEFHVYKKYMDRVPFIFKSLLHHDIQKMQREEVACWKRADALVAVSKEDMGVMKQFGLQSHLVANGVNQNAFTYRDSLQKFANNENRILFLGDFRWIQNKDAVSYILKEIWPALRRLFPNNESKLWIVGRQIPKAIQQLTKDTSVIFDEQSSQLPTPEIFHKANVLLAPLRVGGGTSYKILEAMSSGTPVVSMKMSADALGAQEGVSIEVGNSPEELASKVQKLLTNKEYYQSISRGGRTLVEQNYTWETIAKNLLEVYQNVVK